MKILKENVFTGLTKHFREPMGSAEHSLGTTGLIKYKSLLPQH